MRQRFRRRPRQEEVARSMRELEALWDRPERTKAAGLGPEAAFADYKTIEQQSYTKPIPMQTQKGTRS